MELFSTVHYPISTSGSTGSDTLDPSLDILGSEFGYWVLCIEWPARARSCPNRRRGCADRSRSSCGIAATKQGTYGEAIPQMLENSRAHRTRRHRPPPFRLPRRPRLPLQLTPDYLLGDDLYLCRSSSGSMVVFAATALSTAPLELRPSPAPRWSATASIASDTSRQGRSTHRTY
jgi:hypothetical protein